MPATSSVGEGHGGGPAERQAAPHVCDPLVAAGAVLADGGQPGRHVARLRRHRRGRQAALSRLDRRNDCAALAMGTRHVSGGCVADVVADRRQGAAYDDDCCHRPHLRRRALPLHPPRDRCDRSGFGARRSDIKRAVWPRGDVDRSAALCALVCADGAQSGHRHRRHGQLWRRCCLLSPRCALRAARCRRRDKGQAVALHAGRVPLLGGAARRHVPHLPRAAALPTIRLGHPRARGPSRRCAP